MFRDWFGIGISPGELSVLQISLRAALTFFVALFIVRVGAKRFLARNTAFDIILAFILGSTLSRAINSSAPLFPTFAGCFGLVLLHRLTAALPYQFHPIGSVVKGHADELITRGRVNQKVMRQHYLSDKDLMEALRLKAVSDPSDVEAAYIERNGDISVVKAIKRYEQ